MHAISRRLALLALGALTVFGTTACGDDEPAGPGASVAGIYALATVNSQAVPSTVYEGNDLGFQLKVEVLSGRLTLNANGTFDGVTTLRQTIGLAPTTNELTSSGTFTRSGNTLTLTDPGAGETYTLTVQGDGSLAQSQVVSGITVNARFVKQ